MFYMIYLKRNLSYRTEKVKAEFSVIPVEQFSFSFTHISFLFLIIKQCTKFPKISLRQPDCSIAKLQDETKFCQSGIFD